MSSRIAVLAACAAVICTVAGAATAASGQAVSVSTAPKREGPYVGWTTGADGAPRYAPAGVILPAAVAGQAGPKLDDLAPQGSDAVARYGEPSPDHVWTTVYVFKPGVADVDLLTLQTDAAVRLAAGLPDGQASAATLGGTTVGRRVLYPAQNGVANGLLIARAGSWVVKVRATGPADRPEAVGAAMDEALAAIRWDEGRAFAPAPAAAALAPCPAEPRRKPAKAAPMDMTSTLLALAAGAAADEKTEDVALNLSRACLVAGAFTPERPVHVVHFNDPENGRRERTLVLMGDAGAVLDVSRDLPLLGGGVKYTLGVRESHDSYSVVRAYKDWPTDQQILDLFKR